MENRSGMKNKELSNVKRELLKKLMVKHGFLIRSICADSEFKENFKSEYELIDDTTGIKSYRPISYSSLLYMINSDKELSEFKEKNTDLIYQRLMDNAFAFSEGIAVKSHIPPAIRLEAIKFMMRVLKPEQFRNNEINIHNSMPTTFICNDENTEQTVAEFLTNGNNQS